MRRLVRHWPARALARATPRLAACTCGLLLLLARPGALLAQAHPVDPAPAPVDAAVADPGDDPALRGAAIERLRAALPAGDAAIQALDEVGGDDVRIVTVNGIVPGKGPSMDIADNGDIYVAITVDSDGSASTHWEVRVYWSQDAGMTWSLFGTLASPTATTWYANPSLHIGEGTQNRVYVACEYYATLTPTAIRVAYKPLASPGSAWSEHTALSTMGVLYQDPSLHSSEQTVGSYVMFLAAAGDDGNGDDIWFTRSTDFGDTWAAGYQIASVSTMAVDRHYATPKVRYGNSGIVSCLYEFAPQASTGLDRALRYRRALNSAASSGDWQSTLLLTSSSNGEHETWGDVAASPVNGDVVITYGRVLSNGTVPGSAYFASTNLGAGFGGATALPTLDPLALVADPTGDFHLGSDQLVTEENAAVMKLDAPLPGSWSAALNFSDRSYYDGYQDFSADCIATDATHGHQAAMAWYRDGANGTADTVFFDAEWHDDAGWPNQAPGFPIALASDPGAPPAICEVDGDDRREIVFGTADGNVRIYNHDGTPVAGWPVDVGSLPSNEAIAVGDIDGDGSNEVVVGNTAGQVFAFRSNGTLMPGFPYQGPSASYTYVSLGRFGPDNRLDIVAVVGARILKLRSDGVRDPDLAITLAGALAGPAAIGDVDHDGDNEYVVLQSGSMNVVTPENTAQATRLLAGKTFYGPAALADLNLDGDLEILATTNQGDVYVMNPDGSDLAGWPKSVSSGSVLLSPIAADISGNAQPEVFWAEQGNAGAEVHAYSAAGSALPGYPQTTGGILLSSPIADYMVGSPEVFLLGSIGGVYSWSNLGATNEGWPKGVSGLGGLTPATGDVDNDGLLDLVCVTYSTNRSLNLIETHASLIRTPGSITRWWPMYGYNPERQFCLACSPLDQVTGVEPGAGAELRLDARPSAGSTFAFTIELPARAPVRLEMFDVGGRRVRTLIKDELPAGMRTVSWDARLDDGARASAGVYYARLTVPIAGRMRHVVRRVAVLP